MWGQDSSNGTDNTFRRQISELYEQNYAMVLQVAYRTIGNKQDAEDVLQTVFMRLIERPAIQAAFFKNPKAYLYRSAINEALNLIAVRQRQQLLDIQGLELPAPDDSDPYIQRVREAMAALKKEAAEILRLYYFDGYDCLDISRLSGRPLSRVFKDLYRARTELKKVILSQEKEHETQKDDNEGDGFSVDPEASEA
jgi:RNA polymerase sigma-70 factor (ECF subfamily)